MLLAGQQQSSADSRAADTQQREHKQQQLAARLAQLPSSNGHAKEQEQPQIPQQLSDADALQAWQLRHSELQELQDKGRAGGWLTSPAEVCSGTELADSY
jgi:hypothetical protein